jgi:hypothetical protein
VNKDLVEMDKQQILSKLKPWVGNNRQWEAFSSYLDDAIEQHHKVMEQSNDVVALHRQQGAIAVLRKLKMLRDEINGVN